MPIDSLKPDPRNAKKHPKRNIEIVTESLRRFGQQKAILVDKLNVIRAGNCTWTCAKALGWTEIWVQVSDLEGADLDAYAIADNRSTIYGEFDEDVLKGIMGELKDRDVELARSAGFTEAELNKLLGEARGNDGGTVLVKDEVVSAHGDVWILGAHRLVCGDCTKKDVVNLALAGAAPRLLITDPPYGVELDMEWRDEAITGKKHEKDQRAEGHQNTSIVGDTKADWSDAFELVPSLDTAYIWHASAFSIEVGTGLRRIGFKLSQQIIWRKPQLVISRQHYHWQHEPCWYARKENALPFLGTRDQSTIWEAASPKMAAAGGGEEKIDHPTQKPLDLYTRAIYNHIEKGQCFYEPFGGSGTGIVAAEMTGRVCLCVEIDPKYADTIVKRWQRMMKQKAINKTRPNVEIPVDAK